MMNFSKGWASMMRRGMTGTGKGKAAIVLIAVVAAGIALQVIAGEPAPRAKQNGQAAALPFTVSSETTILEGPLTESGLVDYLAAFNEQGMQGIAPEDNAAVVYLKAFGPAELPYEYRDQYFEELGIEPLPNDGEYLEPIGDYIVRVAGDDKWKQEELQQQYYQAMQMAWQDEDCPEIAQWMKENEPYLELAIKATEYEHYFMPQIRLNPTGENVLERGGMEMSTSLEDMVAYLQMRAMRRLADDDLTGAFEQLIAIRRLDRQRAQSYWSTGANFPGQHYYEVYRVEEQLLVHRDYSAKYSRLFVASMSKLPEIRPLAETFDQAERYASLDQIQQLSMGNLGFLRDYGRSNYTSRPVNLCMQLAMEEEIDWDEVMRTVNEWFDRLVEVAEHETWEERRDAYGTFLEEYQELMSENTLMPVEEMDPENYTRFLAAQIVALRFQQIYMRFELPMMTEARRSLRMASMAIEAYERDNETYPRELDDLVPGYLTEIPTDPFSGEGVLYQRRGRQYLLYSVGQNTRDDDGDYDYYEKDDVTLRN